MINPKNFFAFNRLTDGKTPKVYWYILDYFYRHREASFPTQKALRKALLAEYKLAENTCTQGAISKQFQKLKNEDIKIGNEIFFIDKIDGHYSLYPRNPSIDDTLKSLFAMRDTFLKETVHEISKGTLVFCVAPSHTEEVKIALETYIGEGTCFGIMTHGEYLVVMLNKKSPNFGRIYEILVSFFDEKEKYKKMIQREKELDQQDREIRKKRASVGLMHSSDVKI